MPSEKIMEELNIECYGVFNVFGVEVWLTETLATAWLWMTILIAFAVFVRLTISRWSQEPKGLQNLVEFIVETMDRYVGETMGWEYKYFGNYFFGVFVVILCFNLSGVIMMRPPTADLSVTAAFAIVTFILIHVIGILKNGKEYFREYTRPFWVMIPLNIISELAKPVSLCFRLFGSTLGGFIIITLAYSLLPMFFKVGFPVVLHGYFDFFAGSLQAFIFVTLSMTFIKEKLPEEHRQE